MSSEKTDPLDLRKIFLGKEEAKRITRNFRKRMVPYLKKHSEKIFTLKGAPRIYGISTTYGPYAGKNLALYLSKNSKKRRLRNIDLREFYSDVEKILVNRVGDRIFWRSNSLIDVDKGEIAEIEFIPIAFKGSFLLEVMRKSEVPLMDNFMLVHAAVMTTGKLLHEAISKKGFVSTFPRVIKDFEKEDPESFAKEIEEADFYIDLQFTEKSIFSLTESEVIEKFSESSLERVIGFELIKEAIPFVIQYEIKSDFPEQKSRRTIAKPDFIILKPFNPIAIFCDSYRYHQRKRDQILKDRRIDRKLQKLSFTVFRFSEEEITGNIEGCIEEIKEHYLGKEYSLSPSEVFTRKLREIDPRRVSEWERRFIEALEIKLSQGKIISLREEKILHQIIDKIRSKK